MQLSKITLPGILGLIGFQVLGSGTFPLPGSTEFVENKGQVTDISGTKQQDVLYSFSYNDVTVYFKKSGVDSFFKSD